MSSTEQQAQGIRRTDLQQHDLSIPGREVVQNRVDISLQALAFKHKHPGEEIIYVLEGSLEYPGRRRAADDAQRRRRPARPGRNDLRGEERRHRQRGGARHVFPSAELRDEHQAGLPNAFARLEQAIQESPR